MRNARSHVLFALNHFTRKLYFAIGWAKTLIFFGGGAHFRTPAQVILPHYDVKKQRISPNPWREHFKSIEIVSYATKHKKTWRDKKVGVPLFLSRQIGCWCWKYNTDVQEVEFLGIFRHRTEFDKFIAFSRRIWWRYWKYHLKKKIPDRQNMQKLPVSNFHIQKSRYHQTSAAVPDPCYQSKMQNHPKILKSVAKPIEACHFQFRWPTFFETFPPRV